MTEKAVLIVDDNAEDREVMRRQLHKDAEHCYECQEAHTGDEALKLIAQNDFACVLLDYALPATSGIDVLKEISHKHPFLPVIMLTGQGNEQIAVEAIKSGAHNYLVKTTNQITNLSRTITAAIEHAAQERMINEQKDHIRQQQEELSSLAHILDDSISEVYIIDIETLNFLHVNKGACVNLGYACDELLEKKLSDILFSFNPIHYRQICQTLLSGSEKKNILKATHQRKDGSTYNVESHMQISTYKQRRVIFQISLDETEKHRVESLQQKLISDLTNSNSELERFAYVASHDLQEPLRTIINFSELIVKDYHDRLDETGVQYLDIVADGARHMQMLVDDLLEYARIEGEPHNPTLIDTPLIVTDVFKQLTASIQETKARIEVGPLPKIYYNPVNFSRLILNLASNALKYRRPDVPPHLQLTCEDKDTYWQFTLTDNGIGIPRRYLTLVFEPFRRLHAWNQYKGTGIGLAVCQKIVEMHGGKIWIESEINHGSTFTFTVPKERSTK